MQTQNQPTVAYPDIATMWNEGQSNAEIARALRLSRNTVAGRVWRMRKKGVELRTGLAEGMKANGDRVAV